MFKCKRYWFLFVIFALSQILINHTIFGQASVAPCNINLLTEGFDMGTPPMGWTGNFDASIVFDEGWTFANGASTVDHINPMDPTGPSGPFEGGYYLYYETSGPAIIGATAAIQTPSIFLKDFRPQLSFYLFMFGADIDMLNVNIITMSGTTTLETFSGQRQTSKTDPWELVQIDLSTYRNQTVQFEFEAMKDGGNLGDIAIDSLEVCSASNPIPTLSQWAVIILTLSLMILSIVGLKQPAVMTKIYSS